jgi:Holliday junction resolvasome RuvABC endonuclease subunit
MSILALDLGTRTGWSLCDGEGLITSGVVEFKQDRWQGGGMRFLRFRAWLDEIHRLSGGFEQLFYEQVRRHAGTDASHLYGGWLAILEVWCEQNSVAYQGVPVGTIKRHATGHGNANKQAMIDAARKRGFSPADDNEADAIAILLWAIETQGGLA